MYWIYCPKARNASHADINWKPATATSASGRSRLIIRKSENDGHLKRDGAALIREQVRGGQFVFSGQDWFFITKHKELISSVMLRNWNTQGAPSRHIRRLTAIAAQYRGSLPSRIALFLQ